MPIFSTSYIFRRAKPLEVIILDATAKPKESESFFATISGLLSIFQSSKEFDNFDNSQNIISCAIHDSFEIVSEFSFTMDCSAFISDSICFTEMLESCFSFSLNDSNFDIGPIDFFSLATIAFAKSAGRFMKAITIGFLTTSPSRMFFSEPRPNLRNNLSVSKIPDSFVFLDIKNTSVCPPFSDASKNSFTDIHVVSGVFAPILLSICSEKNRSSIIDSSFPLEFGYRTHSFFIVSKRCLESGIARDSKMALGEVLLPELLIYSINVGTSVLTVLFPCADSIYSMSSRFDSVWKNVPVKSDSVGTLSIGAPTSHIGSSAETTESTLFDIVLASRFIFSDSDTSTKAPTIAQTTAFSSAVGIGSSGRRRLSGLSFFRIRAVKRNIISSEFF